MGFRLPDLIVESVIRDGFAAVRQDPSIIDDVFSDLVQTFASKKYGQKEINRIKEFCRNKEVRVVQAFAQIPIALPCFSIQLLADNEDKALARMDDFEADVTETFTDPQDIANEIILSGLSVTSYDPKTGLILLPNGTNLTNVHPNQIFEDASGADFKILGGINTATGWVTLQIATGEAPNIIGPCLIKSSINYEQFELRGTSDQVQLLVGIHSEDRLLTIYLYTLLKYFLTARKLDLINRGIQLPSFSGSDFTRNTNFAEPVFERFLTVSGMVQDTWNSNQVVPIEDVEIEVEVQKDVATNEQLGFTDETIQVDDDDKQD